MRRDAPWRTEHEEENHGIFELFCYYLINAKALRQQRSAGWALFAFLFFFQAEDGIRDRNVTGVQTCAPPISRGAPSVPRTWTVRLPPPKRVRRESRPRPVTAAPGAASMPSGSARSRPIIW